VNAQHPVHKLLNGALIFSALDGFSWNPNDPFLLKWKEKDASFVERVRASLPEIKEDGKPLVADDYFQKNTPYPGSSYVYDAVMMIALGYCNVNEAKFTKPRPPSPPKPPKKTEEVPPKGKGSSRAHHIPESILNSIVEYIAGDLKFHGASDVPNFRHVDRGRQPTGTTTGVYNIRRDVDTNTYSTVLVSRRWFEKPSRTPHNLLYMPDNPPRFESMSPIRFANGLAVPPEINLFISNENFLTTWSRVLGIQGEQL